MDGDDPHIDPHIDDPHIDDPHIHVQRNLRDSGAVRNLVASTFGLAADLPSVVSTGCGRRVPFAMTSTVPEHVTCLPCREHAHDEHLRSADQIDTLGRMPGSAISAGSVDLAAHEHRALAKRFADPDD